MSTYGVDEVERISRLNEQRLSKIQDLSEHLADVVGVGHSAGGLVRVAVGGGAALRKLFIDPRAMRWEAQELTQRIMEAAEAASADLQAKMEKMMRETLGDDMPSAMDYLTGRRSADDEINQIQSEFSKSLDQIASDVERLQRQMGGRPPGRDPGRGHGAGA